MPSNKITAIAGGLFAIAAFAAGFPGVLPQDTPKLPFLIITIILALISAFLFIISYFDLRYVFHNLYVLKKLGVTKIHLTGGDGRTSKETSISNAERIKFMAVSGEGFIKAYKQALINSIINKKRTIQILLATPNSSFVSDVELTESENRVGHISPEIKKVFAMLKEYINEAKNTSREDSTIGRIYIGFYTTHLRGSILICDNKSGWLTLNLPPTRAIETPAFELKQINNGLLDISNKHFDRVWGIC